MTDMERDLVRLVNRMYRALERVKPQVRGAIPVIEVREAMEQAVEVAERYAHACRVCGEATMLDVCEGCQAEADMVMREQEAEAEAEARLAAALAPITQEELQAAAESERKQRANAAAVADGGWPIYPEEY